jgi:hypothetical protein
MGLLGPEEAKNLAGRQASSLTQIIDCFKRHSVRINSAGEGESKTRFSTSLVLSHLEGVKLPRRYV